MFFRKKSDKGQALSEMYSSLYKASEDSRVKALSDICIDSWSNTTNELSKTTLKPFSGSTDSKKEVLRALRPKW
jgi:hypothetical protein